MTSFGTELVLASSVPIAHCMLDDTHAICAYYATNTTAHIITIGEPLSAGSAYPSTLGFGTPLGIFKLDSTHVIMLYRTSTSINCVVMFIDGSYAITYGTPLVVSNSPPMTGDHPSGALLDLTHLLVGYNNSTTYDGLCKVVVIDGSYGLSAGSEYTFDATYGGSVSVATIDSTHALLCYTNNGGGAYALRVTVSSGTNCSFGSAYFYGLGDGHVCCMLDSTHAIVSNRYSTAQRVETKFATLNSDAITFGDAVYIHSADASSFIGLIGITSTTFWVLFGDASSYTIYLKLGTVSGTVISYGSASQVDTGIQLLNYCTVCFITSAKTRVLVSYANGDSGSLKASIASITLTAVQNNAVIDLSWTF